MPIENTNAKLEICWEDWAYGIRSNLDSNISVDEFIEEIK